MLLIDKIKNNKKTGSAYMIELKITLIFNN